MGEEVFCCNLEGIIDQTTDATAQWIIQMDEGVGCQVTRAPDACSQCQGEVEDGAGVGKLESAALGEPNRHFWGPSQSCLLATSGLTAYSSGDWRK